MQIKKELQKNKQVMQEAFRDCGDIIMREFRIRGGEGTAEGEAEEGGQTEQNGCGTAVYGGFGAS